MMFDHEYLITRHLIIKTDEKDSIENLIYGQILSHLKIHLALLSTSHGLQQQQ